MAASRERNSACGSKGNWLPRFFALGAICTIGCCGISAASAVAEETCTPPATMKARFDKPDAAAFTDLGVYFAGQQNYTCAANAFATSLQMEPAQKDVAHVAFMFGSSLYFSGDLKEAIASLQEAEKLGYHDIKIHLILAAALDAAHATPDAEAEWRAAIEIDPEASNALDSLSNDLISDGDFKGAIDLLEKPRLLGQRTVQQSLNLGAAYAKSGKLEEAARVLRDGLNTTPDSLELANGLAEILNQLGRKEEATMVLEVARSQHAAQAQLPSPSNP